MGAFHVTRGTIELTWDSQLRLAALRFVDETHATGKDAVVPVAAMRRWIGPEHRPFWLLGDGAGLAALDADNALRHGGAQLPHIEIDASHTDDEVTMWVRDNGQGIDPRYHDQVFLPFSRLKQRDKAHDGSGLGLSYVRRVLEGLDGRITLESALDRGATFFLRVPKTREVA